MTMIKTGLDGIKRLYETATGKITSALDDYSRQQDAEFRETEFRNSPYAKREACEEFDRWTEKRLE